MHAVEGPAGYLMNCHIGDPFPRYRASKWTGRGPAKLSRVVSTGNPLNLIPCLQNKELVRIQRQHGFLREGSKRQLMEPPQWGWKTLQQRKNELLEILEKKKKPHYFLKGWEMWPARPLAFSPGLENSRGAHRVCTVPWLFLYHPSLQGLREPKGSFWVPTSPTFRSEWPRND